MRMQVVVDHTGSETELATEYAVSGYDSPFSRGREAVLVINPSEEFDGTCLVETDNTTSGGYADVFAVTDLTTTTENRTQFRNITLGDNVKVTTTSGSTGSLQVYLLGDT